MNTGYMELSGDLNKAKNYAVKILGMRDHSGAELIKKLSKYYDAETCRAALEWVREIGYQDDGEYAGKLAAHLINKNYGLRKVRYEMKLKGLSNEVIEDVLEDYGDNEILGKITDIIKRKYSELPNDRLGIKKVVDALMRRGYDYGDIKLCIERIRRDIELDD